MLNFILGLAAGLFVGLAIYILRKEGPTDGVMTFDPLGEEIVGLVLDLDLYTLSKKKEIRLKVKNEHVKEALNGDYMGNLEAYLEGNRLRDGERS